MTALFDSYESECIDVIKSIRANIDSLRATLSRDTTGYTAPPATGPLSRVERGAQLTVLMTHVKELLNDMEYESNDVTLEQRRVLKDRIAQYRRTVHDIEEEIARTRSECSAADRLDLFGATARKTGAAGGDMFGLDDETARHRLAMMQNTQKVKQASDILGKTERLLNETEETGAEALQTLRKQTETMHHINSTTISVNEEISEVRKILTRMHRTMIKHKVMLIGIIIFLLFLIVLALYVSVSKHRRQKPVDISQNFTSAPSLPVLSFDGVAAP